MTAIPARMESGPTPIRLVLQTYLARWQLWLAWAALATYTILVLAWSRSPDGDGGWNGTWGRTRGWAQLEIQVPDVTLIVLLLSLLVSVVSATIAMHVRETVAQWRSRLVPGHRATHLAVAASVFTAAVGYVPLVMWLVTGMPLLGLAAFLTAVAAAVAWFEYLQTVRAAVFFVGFAILMFSERTATWIAALVLGVYPWTAVSILLAGIACLGLLGWTMGRRAEPFGQPDLPGEMGLRRTRVAGWAVERRLENLSSVANAGFWARVRHWRVVTGAQRVTWLFALAYSVILLVLPWMGDSGGGQAMLRSLLVILTLVCPLLVASLGGEEGLWRRRGYELTWPESRPRLVAEVLAASALDFATVWFWMALASLVPLLFWIPELRTGQGRVGANLPAMLVAITGAHVFVFGVQIALPRGGWKYLGSMTRLIVMTGLTLGFFILTTIIAEGFGAPGLYAWAGALTALGLLLTLRGYENWVQGDFE